MKLFKTAKRVISHHVNQLSPLVSVNDIIEQNTLDNDYDCAKALPYKDIPGPKPLPLVGNTWRFIPYIGDFEIEHVDKVSKRLFEKYGSIVKLEGLLGRPDMVFLFDPDNIETVYRQEDVMPLRPSMPSLNYYKHVYRKEFFENNAGVIAVHGQDWQNFRSKVNQILLQPRIARMYVKPMENTAKTFVERIGQLRDEKQEMPPDFLNEIHKWSLETIARVALDVRLGCLDKNSHPDTQKLIDAVNTFFINVPILELKIPFWKVFNTSTFKQYIAALDTITSISMKHVDRALSQLARSEKRELSVLQRVLGMDNDTKTACVLALDMFLVGIDTTSNAVASILYQLALHPNKQQDLYDEISNVLQTPEDTLDHNKLDQMVYLKACIKETMRMYPVVIGNGRSISRDCIIGGYHIPKGVQVIFQHCVISNTNTYFPKSNEFIPERWLKSCPKNIDNTDAQKYKSYHPFASLPFGYGRRMCLGRRYAELEIQTVIAKVVQAYKIEYHYEKLDYHVHPMYTPNGPLKLKFIDRLQNNNH